MIEHFAKKKISSVFISLGDLLNNGIIILEAHLSPLPPFFDFHSPILPGYSHL